MNSANPIIRVMKYRAKYGATTTEYQILEDVEPLYYGDPREAFQNAVKKGLIAKDGKNLLGDDLWIIPGHPIKKLTAEEIAEGDRIMAEADAYARERAAERARLNPQPPAKIEHNA